MQKQSKISKLSNKPQEEESIMLSTERKDLIMEVLQRKKHVSTNDLAEELYCSTSTIRRELIELEQKGLVERHHGGVSIIPKQNKELPRIFREKEALDEKKYIADLAKIFLIDGQAIFIDASSTANQLCTLFPNYSNLTVVTNGLKTALDLSMIHNLEAFFAGGEIKLSSNASVGEITNEFIKRFKMNITFLSCRGIDEAGLYEADYAQAAVKNHMIEHAEKTILLIDDSKIGKSHFYKLSGFEKIDTIITNKKPTQSIIDAVEKAGSEIIW